MLSIRMQGMVQQRNGFFWSKQPRPLENGNWVCEDPHCGNVNYPRRIECHKCGKQRGPIGDAVVNAYLETLKNSRREVPHSMNVASPTAGCLEHMNLTQGMLRHAEFDIPLQSASVFMNDFDPWIEASFEPLPYFGPQYVTRERNFSNGRSNLSAATEGKRLAEHLVASFAASADPIGDAGECLASAALWLQTMKYRLQAEEGCLSSSLLVQLGSQNFGGVSMPLQNGTVNMLSQTQLCTSIDPASAFGIGAHPNSNLSGSPGSRAPVRASIRFEGCKDRYKDYFRDFGGPVAVTAPPKKGGSRPEPGVNGNWECEECRNVNFPRRRHPPSTLRGGGG